MTRRDAFEALFDLGGTNVDSDILIEASIPLELSGEAVRGRICTFTDEAGKEWALRPDLTLPVAMAEVEARRGGVSGAHVRRYRGPVFRLPALPGEPVEYDQIGLERFGFKSDWEEDVRMVDALVKACRAEGVSGGVMRCGDLSIFPAIVDALGLSEDTANGLKRAFRQEGGVRAYLKGQDAQDTTFAARFAGMPREEVAAFVDDIFAMTGIKPVGERSADEIVE
ncbi:MAG: ATP phosphoribosyltransferase regulatory subunit, partial [Pseudomonadota bacterium]